MIKKNVSNQSKRLHIWLPLLLSTMVVLGMVVGMKMQRVPLVQSYEFSNDEVTLQGSKLEELMRYIENRYVDDIDRQRLEDKAINAILEELDPHSSYISVDQLERVNERLEGNFDGIGIEFLVVDDTIVVMSAIPGGPSEEAGVLAGDKLIAIDDSIVAGKEEALADTFGKLRGAKGSTVKVSFKRGHTDELIDLDIVRDRIPIYSVNTAYMLDEETGYIKVSNFSATTHREFMDSLTYMVEKEQLKNLVIDLRQNPGGYLQEATKMLSQLFQDNKQLLVYTEGRQVKRTDYNTTGRPFHNIQEIAVLIDENSASASEIIAGAMQDWDRGVVVGRRSFGKGLVQEQYPLRDGSALRLTVARYYTPSGRSIQKPYDKGLEYDDDLGRRISSGELFSQDSITLSDTTEYFTLKENRVVFGGGGITPDIFVPADSLTLHHDFLVLSEYIPQFVFRYLENGKQETYSNIADFQSKFRVSESMWSDFIAYATEKSSHTVSPKILITLKKLLKHNLKARVAYHYFGMKGRYKVLNERDAALDAAFQYIQKKKLAKSAN